MHSELEAYLKPGRRVHLVGIGGVSMSPLAQVLLRRGVEVSGSDQSEGASVRQLREAGVPVFLGHRAENLAGAECLIRTAAAREDNPEIAAARAMGLPVFERAQAWGVLMREYENALCVSGTHGKTTTTSMCTHILMEAGRDPSVMLGGTLPLLGGGWRLGQGDTMVLEACEYCNSFLSFAPTVAVILNVDADHLDFFKDLEDIQRSFRRFAQLVPPEGVVVWTPEDENSRRALEGLARPQVTFGLEEGEVHLRDLVWEGGLPRFTLCRGEKALCQVRLNLPGLHNVRNALAAAAACLCLGVEPEAIARGLAAFHGAGRRLERKGSYHGAELYDDYAHHPRELEALLKTAKSLPFRRVVCAFQPHTYSRTHELFRDFVQVLKEADVLLLAEIYAAGEQNTLGISSRDLARQIPGAIYCQTLQEVTQQLAALAQPGDLLLTVGAGDIYRAGEELLRLGGDGEET